MSWRGIANLDAQIFAVPLEGTTSKLGPIVSDDPVWDPESAYDELDELILKMIPFMFVVYTKNRSKIISLNL